MGSSRLPGKVLMNAGDKPIVERVIGQLKRSKHISQLVVATTTQPEDDSLAQFCTSHEINVYRGSDWDVLDRYYEAAKESGAKAGDHVIRICCDNPLITSSTVDFVIEEHLKLGTDYFSNSNQEPFYLEDGFDTEIFTFEALEKTWQNAQLLSQREHVTPYIKQSGLFRCGWRKSHARYHYKLSVDTSADLELANAILKHLGESDFGIEEVVHLLETKPELLQINPESTINSGYYKSLKEDRIVK